MTIELKNLKDWTKLKSLLIRWLTWYPKTFAECQMTFAMVVLVFGILNYEGVLEENKPLAIKVRRWRIIPIISFFGILLILVTVLYLKFIRLDPENKVSYYSIIFLYSLNFVIAMMSMFLNNYKSASYIKLGSYNQDVTNEMNKLGLNITFRYAFYFILSYIGMFVFAAFIAFITNGLAILLDYCSLFYPYGIRMCVMVQSAGNILFFYTQFTYLKKYALDLERNSHLTESDNDNSTEVLENISKYYDCVVKLTDEIDKMYGFIIFINLFANTIEVVFTAMVLILGGIQGVNFTIIILLYVCGNIFYAQLYFFSNEMKKQSEDIFVILGLLHITYLNKKTAFVKNTMLLQGMHKAPANKIFGVIPMNLSIFLKQIDVGTTLLLIAMQYVKK